MSYDSGNRTEFAAAGVVRAHQRESLLRLQGRIWLAIMLRGMRSRFFGNGLGFAVQVAWPAAHIAVLVGVHALRKAMVPYGTDPVLFYTAGVLPMLTFVYISRYTAMAMVWDAPLLAFPVIKPLDLLFGRMFLEVISAFLVCILILAVLSIAGFDVMPRHIIRAFSAYGACVFLGCGFAVLNGVIARMYRVWITGYALVIILCYITSGAIATPDEVPPFFVHLMQINPIFHGVIWARSAYYDGYGADLLEKWYILAWGLGTLWLGLVLERFARNRLLHR